MAYADQQLKCQLCSKTSSFKTNGGSLYRGQRRNQARDWVNSRGIQSWSGSLRTASYFAKESLNGIVIELYGKFHGVEISEISYWRNILHKGNHYGGMQAEWLVLDSPTYKTKIIEV